MTMVEVSLLYIRTAVDCERATFVRHTKMKTEHQQQQPPSRFSPLADALLQLSEDAAVEGVHLWEFAQYLP